MGFNYGTSPQFLLVLCVSPETVDWADGAFAVEGVGGADSSLISYIVWIPHKYGIAHFIVPLQRQISLSLFLLAADNLSVAAA